ncbi:Nucleoside triphosphate pyrophosphohydrolase/pyrophosphatase MazG [Porphyromonas macacae]|uniref:Nucleoside triphosphate pyrophosphohydrolase/pyrophosphatase MazG n=1 Tax=Porphyromonas macacae TaxID=28115 RepID=A0A379EBI6_9PORP|nr:Nucleoside triphosphate pyrophosphohydrolase/pyrophosphatase MazG [Porphyromonas macacae]
MHTREEQLRAFSRLLDVLDRLRVECPWDRKQTNESLRINTIEEVYELSEALLADDPAEIKKELGDVLLHVCFYSKIASEQGRFDLADVADGIAEKLIFRHPHIYGDVKADTPEAVERKLGANQAEGERRQQNCFERCARLPALPDQSHTHTGQSPWRRFRLG